MPLNMFQRTVLLMLAAILKRLMLNAHRVAEPAVMEALNAGHLGALGQEAFDIIRFDCINIATFNQESAEG